MEDIGREQLNISPVRPAQHSLIYTLEHLTMKALNLPCHAQGEQRFQILLCGDMKPRTYCVERRAHALVPELKREVVVHHSPAVEVIK